MNRPCRVLQIAAALFPLVAFAGVARADIFQWEYINPANHSQGKQQSTTLTPGGAGVDAVPGAILSNRNLTMAYLIGAELTGAYAFDANLTDADFSGADLSHAALNGAILRNASLVGANLFGADLSGSCLPRCGDLPRYADLTGADFSGADVRWTNFSDEFVGGPTPGLVSGTDGRGANLSNVSSFGPRLKLAQLYSTASYQAHDLTGIRLGDRDLAGGNFTGQNLTNASFRFATLTDVDFAGAEVRGAQFGYTALTLPQLYLTASYQAHDLTGILLERIDLAGGKFAGQNLTNAAFYDAYLIDADFREASLTNAFFFEATLTGADFTAADARGAGLYPIGPLGAITTNLIRPNGHIDGLDLDAGGRLIVRDYDANVNPIPITIDQHFAMSPGGTLRMVFESDAWDSTISFAPGIPVALGGTLELTFAADVNLASQVGRTFDLFNWAGVTPIGAFAISSPYQWNLANLYTTGEVTLAAVPEPASFALAVSGVFVLTYYRRKKKP